MATQRKSYACMESLASKGDNCMYAEAQGHLLKPLNGYQKCKVKTVVNIIIIFCACMESWS